MSVVNERIITLDDFAQLQALLDYEQKERDKHVMQCHANIQPVAADLPPSLHERHHQQFHRAINPQASLQSSLESARLAEASMRLKNLRAQYKRRRTLEVQVYLDNYRRQALIRAVLPENEELYYRQCIAAALEQRRVEVCLLEYIDIKRLQDMQNQIETQLFLADQEEPTPVVEDEMEGYDTYRTQQLEALLKYLFSQQEQEEFAAKTEQEEAEDMVEVWKLLSNQKMHHETPRSAFLDPDHDLLLGMDTHFPAIDHEQPRQDVSDQKVEIEKPIDQIFERQEQFELNKPKDTGLDTSDKSKEQEHTEEIKKSPKIEVKDTYKFKEHIKETENHQKDPKKPEKKLDELKPDEPNNKKPHISETSEAKQSTELKEDNEKNLDYDVEFPPLQNHVVPLQGLIQRLASEPVLVGKQQTHFSDEPKPSGIWAKKLHVKSPPPPPLSTQPEDKKASFLPQHIFTEAEPTPTLENMPNTPLGQEEEGEEDSQHFVNSVAAEQKNGIVPPDPRKTKMIEELESVSHQLQDKDSELVKRWEHVLQGGDDGDQHLDFSKQQGGTLVLTATTAFNRQFLGSEDELVRTLIRLDAIDSMGDDSIRKKRKNLVRICESMLDKLDAFKQSQWEKAIVK